MAIEKNIPPFSAEALALLGKGRVLCLGDVMLDHYLYGDVERISPEAPIPILRIQREKKVLGGVGNVARNLAAFTTWHHLVAVIGTDSGGEHISTLLNEECAPYCQQTLLKDSNRHTTHKTRHIAANQQLLRTDDESLDAVSDDLRNRVLNTIQAAMSQVDMLVLSDYGKGLLCPIICQQAINLAQQHKVPVLIDPKGKDYGKYTGATFITPNRKELAEATGMATVSDSDVEAACRVLIERFSINTILATRSEKGMSIVSRNSTSQHIPTEALEVYDVSGAGDTVVAALAAALAAGLSLQEAASLANCAAGIVVAKQGTATASLTEIRRALKKRDSVFRQQIKIMDLAQAAEQAAAWQAEGLRVGFTNGCFDILHAGHISILSYARQHCDRLIVGLNSDSSVQRLKGTTRPVNPETDRADVLAALEPVDGVVIFPEDTPFNLITTLKPDVLVKGADYTIDRVVGAADVQQRGGTVLLAPLLPGRSTSRTIEKMAQLAPAP